jgi:DNA-binding SARP family transcriptional activator
VKSIKAAAALAAIAILIAGPPLLLAQAGWPLPDHLPGLDEVWTTATRPPSDLMILNAAVLLGWGLWAALVRAFAAELWAQARRPRKARPVSGSGAGGPLRWVAAVLIAALVSAGPATAAVPADAEPIAVAVPVDPAAEPNTEAPGHPQQDDAEQVVHVVEQGDTLWEIAGDDDYLDDPRRYPEIFEANEGKIQDDGRSLEAEDLIYPGWELTIPISEDVAGANEAPPTSEDDQIEPDPTESEPESGEETPPSPTEEASESPTATASDLPEDPDSSAIEDGLAPAPSTADPDQVPSSEPEGTTGQPDESEPSASATDVVADGDSNWLQTGLWLTAGTFLAAGTGFSLFVLLRRRRSAPPDDGAEDDRTLTGRLADLEAIFDDEEIQTPPSDTVLPLAQRSGPRAATEISLLDWATDGLGLSGPGAPAVIRAALINAAASQVPVIITARAAETISLHPTTPPAWLTVVPDLDAALDIADERIEDPVFDLSAGRIDLPPLLLIADNPEDRAQRLAEVLKHDLVGALLLGDWETAALTVAADGTVTDHHPPEAELESIERCYIADLKTLTEAFTVTGAPPRAEETNDAPRERTLIALPDSEDEVPEFAQPQSPHSDERPRLILLGTPSLLWNGKPVQWRRRRSLLLLTALATAPEGRGLDDLLETVVGDSHVDKARGHLGTVTSDTRRDVRDTTGLDIRAVLHDDQTDRYRLHPDIASDIADFHLERHLAATSTTDTERADHLARALACYGGDFATGLDDDWLEPTRTELREAAYTTCLHLAALHRDANDLDTATAVLERATAIDRTRPDAWAALIDARIAAGDEVGAQKARRGQRLWATGDHNTTPM